MSLCQGNRGKGCCSLNSPFLRKTRVGSLRDRAISSFRGRINDENLLKSLCRLRLRKFVSAHTESPQLCSELAQRGQQAIREFPRARGGVPGVRETNCPKCSFFKRLRRRNSFPLICGQQKRIAAGSPAPPQSGSSEQSRVTPPHAKKR